VKTSLIGLRGGVLAVTIALLGVSLPGTAAAYCRQKTCERDDCLKDANGCIVEGDDLFYGYPCLSFAIDEGSGEPLGLSDAEMNDIVTEAFAAWQAVECPGGGNPNFQIESAGTVAASGIFFCEEETLNASVWTLESDWDYEASALGYTTTTFVVDTGEVFDADVELNLMSIAGMPFLDVTPAVLSIATHEAGHFLGLAHSDVPSAVMAASYSNLSPRPLTDDDIAGICELYPPDGERLRCSTPGISAAATDEEACEAALAANDEPDAGGCSISSVGRPAMCDDVAEDSVQDAGGCELASSGRRSIYWMWAPLLGVLLRQVRRRKA
jgi:hypothetical protein